MSSIPFGGGPSAPQIQVPEISSSDGPHFAKYARMEVDEEEGQTATGANEAGGSGARKMAMEMPYKFKNVSTRMYTKNFYMKLYSEDWIRQTTADGGNIIGFMNVIPYQALCMYLSPNEYQDIQKCSQFAKIEECTFEVKVISLRTPFFANSTDVVEANGNLRFCIQRWDNLEKMLPFRVVDVDESGTVTEQKTYAELINRLYGSSHSQTPIIDKKWPAAERERSLSHRPLWKFKKNPVYNDVMRGWIEFPINAYISTLPVGEYKTAQALVSAHDPEVVFTRNYRPKNGLITMAPSAFSDFRENVFSQINLKERFATTGTNPTKNTDPQFKTFDRSITLSGGFSIVVTRERIFNTERVRSINFPATIAQGTNYAHMACKVDKNQVPIEVLKFTEVWDDGEPDPMTIVNDVKATDKGAVNSVDDVGYNYGTAMAYYTVADIENYAMLTSRNEFPVHHMSSFALGIRPKTNRDDTIVKCTVEVEITTTCKVSLEHCNLTYSNLAYVPVADGSDFPVGFMDKMVKNIDVDDEQIYKDIYARRWQHNETDVSLNDNSKYWDKSYGLASKMQFTKLPATTPL